MVSKSEGKKVLPEGYTHIDHEDYTEVIVDDDNPYRMRHWYVPKDHVPMVKCKYCHTKIWWLKEDGKWIPMKPRNGRHTCAPFNRR